MLLGTTVGAHDREALTSGSHNLWSGDHFILGQVIPYPQLGVPMPDFGTVTSDAMCRIGVDAPTRALAHAVPKVV
jgi:hypothetical protein